MLCDGLCVYSKYFCTSRYIVRQRAYVIYDAIVYSKRPLLRLRPLPSSNELSAVKAHCMAFEHLLFAINGRIHAVKRLKLKVSKLTGVDITTCRGNLTNT